MNIGLLDVPGYLLGPLDHLLGTAGVPALVRVLLWGGVAGYLGMWIYRRVSPQERLAAVKTELAAAQKAVAVYDGDFGGLLPLIRAQFGLALRQLRLSTAAALLAALPVLLVLPWLSNEHGARAPGEGAPVRLCVAPAGQSGVTWPASASADATDASCRIVPWPGAGSSAILAHGATTLVTLPTPVPSRIVHKRVALNVLVGNPAGYLPEDTPVEAVTLEVPSAELVAFGPSWMRGWELPFFLSALVVSLVLRWRWRLT